MLLPIKIQFKSLRPDHPMPSYGTEGAACADVYASIPDGGTITIFPNQAAMVKLGFAVGMPPGWELQVRPRSGLASKGLIVANSPGCVDEDYRGEVAVLLRNLGDTKIVIEDRMRVAQISPAIATRMNFQVVDELSVTKRGEGGFGSTGT